MKRIPLSLAFGLVLALGTIEKGAAQNYDITCDNGVSITYPPSLSDQNLDPMAMRDRNLLACRLLEPVVDFGTEAWKALVYCDLKYSAGTVRCQEGKLKECVCPWGLAICKWEDIEDESPGTCISQQETG